MNMLNEPGLMASETISPSSLLTDNLPLLAGAPNGIQKLRNLILELAINGRLLSIASNIWTDHLLGDLGSWGSGGTPSKAHPEYYNGDIPWLVIGDLNDGLVSSSANKISQLGLQNSSAKLIPKGTIMIAMYGSIGKLGIAGIECATNQAIAYCRPYKNLVSDSYLFLLLKAIRGSLIERGQGLAQQNISQKIIKSIPVKLPSLTEQNLIVAKVDELMALCDRLEAQQADAESAHARLVQALLDSLTQAYDADDFAASWQRLAKHFHTLFTTESSIDVLKQTLLQLAVMGKLVPQDPSDEPASELLKRIAEEKARLVATGKIKKQKPLKEITKEEMAFEKPNGWDWVRLEELAQLITKGSSPKWQGISYTEDHTDILFVTSENVGRYQLRLDSKKYVERKFNEIEPRSILSKGDFLMNIVGASIGRTAIFELDLDANINQAVCLIRCVPNLMNSQFLLYFFNSETCLSYMFDKQVDNARANLSMGNIASFVLPIPPLAEQQRIVAKIDGLVALCEQLKARIGQVQQIQEHLAKALVEQAVA